MFVKLITILLVLGAVAQANSFNGRIINGENATGVVPYHVLLGIRRGQDPEYAGSGIVITLRLVLTTASNIFGFDTFRAGYGHIERQNLDWVDGIIAEVIESYNSTTYENNVGFIIFAANAFNNGFSVPISIPPLTLQQNLPFENEQGQIAGFGWTEHLGPYLADTLQISFSRVVSRETCSNFFVVDQETNFCVIDNVNSSKICAGDQGAAFVTSINGQVYLTGIASYILNYTCAADVPSLFVRTLSYRSYIDVMASFWR